MIAAKVITIQQADKSLKELQLTFTEESIHQLYILINRALNTNPEFCKDWFELSDKIEEVFITPQLSGKPE